MTSQHFVHKYISPFIYLLRHYWIQTRTSFERDVDMCGDSIVCVGTPDAVSWLWWRTLHVYVYLYGVGWLCEK